MKFIKDILLVETTTTGVDVDKDAILQITGILLDKDNLLEKSIFNSYVRVSLLENIIQKHSVVLGIKEEQLQKSPKIYDAVKKFNEQFGNSPMLATHNIANIFFLRNAYKKANVPWEFEPHILELWTLQYIYSLSYGIKKMPTLSTLLDHFRIPRVNHSNSLERAKAESIVFKKIIGIL